MDKIILTENLAKKIEDIIFEEEDLYFVCNIIDFKINRKEGYKYSPIYNGVVKYNIYNETLSYLVIATMDNMKKLCKMKFNDKKEVKDTLFKLSETFITYNDGFNPKELCIDFPCLKKFFSNYKQRKNIKKVLRKKDYSNE